MLGSRAMSLQDSLHAGPGPLARGSHAVVPGKEGISFCLPGEVGGLPVPGAGGGGLAPSAGVANPRLPCHRPGSDGIPAGAIALLVLLRPRRDSMTAAAYAALLDRLMPAVLYCGGTSSRTEPPGRRSTAIAGRARRDGGQEKLCHPREPMQGAERPGTPPDLTAWCSAEWRTSCRALQASELSSDIRDR
jgi:hypothetical protein